jgi:hypothetical protein
MRRTASRAPMERTRKQRKRMKKIKEKLAEAPWSKR